MDRKKQIEDQIAIVSNTIQEYRIPEKKARTINAIQGWTEKGFTLSDEDLKKAIEKGHKKVRHEKG